MLLFPNYCVLRFLEGKSTTECIKFILNTFDFINRSFSESIFILLAHKFQFTEYAWQVSYVNVLAVWRGEGKTNFSKHLSKWTEYVQTYGSWHGETSFCKSICHYCPFSSLQEHESHTLLGNPIKSLYINLREKQTNWDWAVSKMHCALWLGESKIQDYRHRKI